MRVFDKNVLLLTQNREENIAMVFLVEYIVIL